MEAEVLGLHGVIYQRLGFISGHSILGATGADIEAGLYETD